MQKEKSKQINLTDKFVIRQKMSKRTHRLDEKNKLLRKFKKLSLLIHSHIFLKFSRLVPTTSKILLSSFICPSPLLTYFPVLPALSSPRAPLPDVCTANRSFFRATVSISRPSLNPVIDCIYLYFPSWTLHFHKIFLL